MDDEVKQAQAALQKARIRAGIDPDTGRSPTPNGSLSASAPTPLRKLGALAESSTPSEMTCGECDGVATVVRSHLRISRYECADCVEGKNRERERRHREQILMARETWLKENVEGIMVRLGVLKEHSAATLNEFESSVATRALSVLEKPEQYHGLLVTGPTGVGKTRILAALARNAILGNKRVCYCQARRLLRRIWNTYRDDAGETEEAVIADFSTCDLLVIDDLAHEGRVSEAGLSALHEIISTRNGNYLPTLISTNLTLAEIANHYDPALGSRLGAWLRIVLTGPDRRQ
jgi:DNA replication protein DnaC